MSEKTLGDIRDRLALKNHPTKKTDIYGFNRGMAERDGISEVKFYSKKLTQKDVNKIYEKGKNHEQKPLGV